MVVGAVADGDAEAFEEDAEQIAGRAGPAEQNVVGGGGVNLDSRQGRQGGGEIRAAFGVLGAGLCREVRGIREDGLRGGQREGVDAPRGQLVPDGLRQLRIGGEISEAYARNGMELVSERRTMPFFGSRCSTEASVSVPAYSTNASSMIQRRSEREDMRRRHLSGVRNNPEGLPGLARKTADPSGASVSASSRSRVGTASSFPVSVVGTH